MFIHDTHLPQLLTSEDYTSQAQLERELETALIPSWQYVGTTSQIPHAGDYFTIHLLGEPLIIWNTGEGIQAFLNVCPHRFSRLKSESCGHSRETLQCQYHGWEFDGDGRTRKIPDAPSFKPMTKGALCLTKFRTEVVGQVIFVTLSDGTPDIRECLGTACEVAKDWCSPDLKMFYSLRIEVDANWKIKIENSLESYHVDMIHPTTFGKTPDAASCEHVLEPGWTSFASREPCDRVLDKLIHRLLRREPDLEYKHYLFYPNLMFGKMRLFRWVEAIRPLGPNRLEISTHFFCYPGSGSWKSRLLVRALADWGKKFFTKVAWEDGDILAEVQKGHASPMQPSTGVISMREERCHHFQHYIREVTAACRCENTRVPLAVEV